MPVGVYDTTRNAIRQRICGQDGLSVIGGIDARGSGAADLNGGNWVSKSGGPAEATGPPLWTSAIQSDSCRRLMPL